MSITPNLLKILFEFQLFVVDQVRLLNLISTVTLITSEAKVFTAKRHQHLSPKVMKSDCSSPTQFVTFRKKVICFLFIFCLQIALATQNIFYYSFQSRRQFLIRELVLESIVHWLVKSRMWITKLLWVSFFIRNTVRYNRMFILFPFIFNCYLIDKIVI